MLGSVLVNGERKTVRLYCSLKRNFIQEVHSQSMLLARLGKSIGSCVKRSHWIRVCVCVWGGENSDESGGGVMLLLLRGSNV